MEFTVLSVSNELNPKDKIDLEILKTFSGKNAGICYMGEKYFNSAVTDTEKALKRFEGTMKTGHHSVSDHIQIEVLFEGISKVLAILLNSLQYYSTSEKSGRYTVMTGNSKLETDLYEKWLIIFKEAIAVHSQGIDDKTLTKMAQENARYILSVFTRSTTMGYTTSLRQWNYIYDWCQLYLNQFTLCKKTLIHKDTKVKATYFEEELYKDLTELSKFIYNNLYVDGLRDTKGRNFSFFFDKYAESYVMNKDDIIGDSYTVSYKASFVHIAQAQRHRTLKYFAQLSSINEPEFFIPPVISNTKYETEWLKDLDKVKHLIPQATLLNIIETGHISDFVLKCKERLCGRAQLEVMLQTKKTAEKFINNLDNFSNFGQGYVEELLGRNGINRKCDLLGSCKEPCKFSREALNRVY